MIVVLAALISARLMFPGGQGVEQFGVAFCNAGFIGIPLVSQLLGEGSLFYLTIYLTVMPLFVWTVGLTLITGDAAGIRWRKIFGNPAMIAFLIGFALFLLPVPIPAALGQTLSFLSASNTPLGMIVLGVFPGAVPDPRDLCEPEKLRGQLWTADRGAAGIAGLAEPASGIADRDEADDLHRGLYAGRSAAGDAFAEGGQGLPGMEQRWCVCRRCCRCSACRQ